MSCCDETTARVPDIRLSRRSLFKGAALIGSVIPAVRRTGAEAQGKQIKLAYCSQLLCGVPYEVARSAGHFKNHGLDVQLVYTRGGNAAIQALVGSAVDYAATSLDVAIQAYANAGASIRRFAVTGRLPLFAVVTAPKTASQIQSIKDLEGRTVGVTALGTADHALTLYLLKQAGADAKKVQFATMGVNLLEALRQNQIDVGLVQEPALTLLKRAGGRVLVNGMDLEDAKRYLGGSFEFMGVAVRAKEIERRRPEMVALTKASGRCAQGPARDDRRAVERGVPQRDDHRARSQGVRRHYRASPRLPVPRSGKHRPRRGQARRAEPHRRRPPQVRYEHGRAPRHHDRRELKLRVRDLTISYGGEPVLERASLAVGEGRFVSLVGPSGSGKSSLLRAVIGLQQPLSGTVETGLAGSEIGILFQDDALLPWKTARDNVALGLTFNGRERSQALAEAEHGSRGWVWSASATSFPVT